MITKVDRLFRNDQKLAVAKMLKQDIKFNQVIVDLAARKQGLIFTLSFILFLSASFSTSVLMGGGLGSGVRFSASRSSSFKGTVSWQ